MRLFSSMIFSYKIAFQFGTRFDFFLSRLSDSNKYDASTTFLVGNLANNFNKVPSSLSFCLALSFLFKTLPPQTDEEGEEVDEIISNWLSFCCCRFELDDLDDEDPLLLFDVDRLLLPLRLESSSMLRLRGLEVERHFSGTS